MELLTNISPLFDFLKPSVYIQCKQFARAGDFEDTNWLDLYKSNCVAVPKNTGCLFFLRDNVRASVELRALLQAKPRHARHHLRVRGTVFSA